MTVSPQDRKEGCFLTDPILYLSMPYRIMYTVAYPQNQLHSIKHIIAVFIPGPAAAAKASSPMKKSRSSVPRFAERCPLGPAPPVRKEGLFATAGRPEPDPPAPPAGPLVAIAVGKTKEGESLPAKPGVYCVSDLRLEEG